MSEHRDTEAMIDPTAQRSELSPLELPKCENPDHFGKRYTWVCTNPSCEQSRLCCSKCLTQSHRHCINYVVHIADLATMKYTNNANILHSREIREAVLLLEKFGVDDDMNARMLKEFEETVNKEFDAVLQHIIKLINETKEIVVGLYKKNLGTEKIETRGFLEKLHAYYNLEDLYRKCEELAKGVKTTAQTLEELNETFKNPVKAKEQELETIGKDIVSKISKNTGIEQKMFNDLKKSFEDALKPFKSFNPQKKTWQWSTINKSKSIALQNTNTKAVKTGTGLTYAAVIGDMVFTDNKHVWEIFVETGNAQAQWVSFGVLEHSLATNWENFNYSQTIGMTTYGQFYQMNKTAFTPGGWDNKTYRCELDLIRGKFEIYCDNKQIATSNVSLKGKSIVPFLILYRSNNAVTVKVLQ